MNNGKKRSINKSKMQWVIKQCISFRALYRKLVKAKSLQIKDSGNKLYIY